MQTGSRDQTLEVLARIAQIVVSNKQLDTVLHAAVNLLRTMLGLERCSVMLLDEQREALRVAAATGVPPELWSTIRIPVGSGISGKVVYERRPVLIEDITKSEFADAAHVERYSSRSFISTPLVVHGEVVGVLNANSRSDAVPFARDDLDRMVAIGSFLAQAIENHQLRHRTDVLQTRITALLDSLDLGILAVDTQYRVIFCNHHLCLWIGAPQMRPEGKTFAEVWPEASRDYLYALIHECLETGQPVVTEAELRLSNGPPQYMRIRIAPFRHNGESVAGVLICLSDISASREADELRRIHALKSDFLAIMSHELRTPLTAMKGAAHLLTTTDDALTQQEREKLLDVVSNNVERLTVIVNNLMDVVALERDEFEIHPARMALAPLALQALAPLLRHAAAKRISITEDIHECEAEVDPEQFSRLVGFLVDNALKFTPPDGQVTVQLYSEGDEIALIVSDTGCGIPPTAKARLFASFSQADHALTRRSGGLGLGLYLAKAIVDVHGGRIEIASKEGLGTTVTVRLPQRR